MPLKDRYVTSYDNGFLAFRKWPYTKAVQINRGAKNIVSRLKTKHECLYLYFASNCGDCIVFVEFKANQKIVKHLQINS